METMETRGELSDNWYFVKGQYRLLEKLPSSSLAYIDIVHRSRHRFSQACQGSCNRKWREGFLWFYIKDIYIYWTRGVARNNSVEKLTMIFGKRLRRPSLLSSPKINIRYYLQCIHKVENDFTGRHSAVKRTAVRIKDRSGNVLNRQRDLALSYAILIATNCKDLNGPHSSMSKYQRPI
jgi:hypothetical protein